MRCITVIAEVILITELLKQTVDTPNSTSKAPSPHFAQSFTLPELAPEKVATAYLEASTGRPESIATKLKTGRL